MRWTAYAFVAATALVWVPMVVLLLLAGAVARCVNREES